MLKARLVSTRLEAGCDEVGRGCLAGPVVAAAVILPPRLSHPDLIDSKKLSASKRETMAEWIRDRALSWGICEVSPAEIDRINIQNASFLAMTRAVQALVPLPEHLLIDGNRFRSELTIPFDCIVKGDNRIGSIAAASILAKTHRDALMHHLHLDHPDYGWNTNVGYPTTAHRRAIANLGITEYHRKSFHLKAEQLSLSL